MLFGERFDDGQFRWVHIPASFANIAQQGLAISAVGTTFPAAAFGAGGPLLALQNPFWMPVRGRIDDTPAVVELNDEPNRPLARRRDGLIDRAHLVGQAGQLPME